MLLFLDNTVEGDNMEKEEAVAILNELKKKLSSDWSNEGNKTQMALLMAVESLDKKCPKEVTMDEDTKEAIRQNIESNFNDMSVHYYNGYDEDSERIIFFSVRELKTIYEGLGGNTNDLPF